MDQSPLIVPIEQLAPREEREEMFEALNQLLRGYRETLESTGGCCWRSSI